MLQPAVTEIIGKTQKKQYDQLDTAKVVGYFETSNDKGVILVFMIYDKTW